MASLRNLWNVLCWNVCPSDWSKHGSAAWLQYIVILCFQLLWTFWIKFQPKNAYVRCTPASTVLIQVSHWSHCHVMQIVTYVVEGKGIKIKKENKGNLGLNHDSSIGATVIEKEAHVRMKIDVDLWKVKPVALAISGLHLSGTISKSVNQSVRREFY